MSPYCIELDWPALSPNANQKIIDCFNTNIKSILQPISNDGVVTYDQSASAVVSTYKDLKIWPDQLKFVKSLLGPMINLDYEDLKFNIQRIKGAELVPHSDVRRTCSLLYNVKGSATTHFWSTENFVPENMWSDKSKLKLEESVVMKLNTWYLFNHYEIHSVTDIDGDERFAFSINLTNKYNTFENARENLHSLRV